jgi:hypothetical protein
MTSLRLHVSALSSAVCLALIAAPANAAPTPAPAVTAPPTTATAAPSTPGNRVHGVVYTIERIRAVKSLGGTDFMPVTRADGVFLILTLRMQNVTSAPISFLTTTLVVVDDTRNLYSVSTAGLTSQMMGGDDSAQLVATLQPGLFKKVTAVFDVPWLPHATFYLSDDDAGARRGGAAFNVPAPGT